jgi:hypothetical protein
MFDLRDFVMSTLMGMVGQEPDYKVRQYALGWYDKAQLTGEDMATLEDKLADARQQDATQAPEEPDEVEATDEGSER